MDISGKGGGHKERVNECEYGRCVLYLYMKIEEWNNVELVAIMEVGDEGEWKRGKSN
jgi:hypothetical protein